jgi:hypothetical protein
MFLNPLNRIEAEPLRQRRKWRDPRCDAYAVSEAIHRHWRTKNARKRAKQAQTV